MSRISPTLHQIAQAWPSDPLRPTIQFGQVLTALSNSPNLSVRAVMAARALSENTLKTQVRFIVVPPRCCRSTLPMLVPYHREDHDSSVNAAALLQTC